MAMIYPGTGKGVTRASTGGGVLFCGAGFSADCLNLSDNEELGTGTALLKLLNRELESNPKAIRAKRPYKRVKLFGAGKLNRLILDAMRKDERPMTTLEIVAAIVAELNFGEDAARGMKSRMRSSLLYLWKVRGSVVKEGERETATWRIA